MSQALGFEVELAMPFEASIERVKNALKEEGFGVLSEIDLRAAFQKSSARSSGRSRSSARAIRRWRMPR